MRHKSCSILLMFGAPTATVGAIGANSYSASWRQRLMQQRQMALFSVIGAPNHYKQNGKLLLQFYSCEGTIQYLTLFFRTEPITSNFLTAFPTCCSHASLQRLASCYRSTVNQIQLRETYLNWAQNSIFWVTLYSDKFFDAGKRIFSSFRIGKSIFFKNSRTKNSPILLALRKLLLLKPTTTCLYQRSERITFT